LTGLNGYEDVSSLGILDKLSSFTRVNGTEPFFDGETVLQDKRSSILAIDNVTKKIFLIAYFVYG